LKKTILSIALNAPIKNLFDYSLENHSGITPKPGQRVRVPFGKQEKLGFISKVSDATTIASSKIRPIINILDERPILDSELLTLIDWTSKYYYHPIGEVFAAAVPIYLRQSKYPKIAKEDSTSKPLALETRKKLTKEQHQSFKDISDAMIKKEPIVLNGITGSGKTELYMQVIERNLKKKEQALVLVPEIGLTPQLLGEFRSRFGNTTAVIHSENTPKENAVNWVKAKNGLSKIIIGTRSSIFTPFQSLGLIIVDEEHDASYKQQSGLRYSARDLSLVRAANNGISVILGSATPSFETLMNVEKKKYRQTVLKKRVFSNSLPSTQMIDLRVHPQERGLTKILINEIKKQLDNKKQSLIYLNRRGYSPATVCIGCGHVEECPRCDTSLVLHKSKGKLICHHCSTTKNWEESCTVCGESVAPLGKGTEQIEEYLKEQFPKTNIIRIDKDTVKSKNSRQEMLSQAKSGKGEILLGTQMLAKGHDFPNLTLVAIVNADQGLFGSDFRSSEKFAQTLLQVSGRAGRRKEKGLVMIQTYNSQNPLLNKIISQDYLSFYKEAIKEREMPQWPPYSHIALLHAESTRQSSVFNFLNQINNNCLKKNIGSTLVLGPNASPIEKKSGRYRGQLLLLNVSRKELHQFIKTMDLYIQKQKIKREVRWAIDVDPIDLS
jgi:primosomal protein N' (replication factor Y)|tara:strand:+ start:1474 stop:3468 length:1995 start_codon:yes stop_codon:yes gene_type:complete